MLITPLTFISDNNIFLLLFLLNCWLQNYSRVKWSVCTILDTSTSIPDYHMHICCVMTCNIRLSHYHNWNRVISYVNYSIVSTAVFELYLVWLSEFYRTSSRRSLWQWLELPRKVGNTVKIYQWLWPIAHVLFLLISAVSYFFIFSNHCISNISKYRSTVSKYTLTPLLLNHPIIFESKYFPKL